MIRVSCVGVFDQVLNEEDDAWYSLYWGDEQLSESLTRALRSGLIGLCVCVGVHIAMAIISIQIQHDNNYCKHITIYKQQAMGKYLL